jgi:hypothetical protein
MARNDATGWKRGAGVYSRSYAKLSEPGEFKLYAKNRDKVGGKDIYDAVSRKAGPDLAPEREKAVEYGYSGEVSRGRRPVHRAGKRSYKRV